MSTGKNSGSGLLETQAFQKLVLKLKNDIVTAVQGSGGALPLRVDSVETAATALTLRTKAAEDAAVVLGTRTAGVESGVSNLTPRVVAVENAIPKSLAITDNVLSSKSGNTYIFNTTVKPISMPLPVTPSKGDCVTIVDEAKTFSTNPLTITSGNTIMGVAESLVCDIDGVVFDLVFYNGTWNVQ